MFTSSDADNVPKKQRAVLFFLYGFFYRNFVLSLFVSCPNSIGCGWSRSKAGLSFNCDIGLDNPHTEFIRSSMFGRESIRVATVIVVNR